MFSYSQETIHRIAPLVHVVSNLNVPCASQGVLQKCQKSRLGLCGKVGGGGRSRQGEDRPVGELAQGRG